MFLVFVRTGRYLAPLPLKVLLEASAGDIKNQALPEGVGGKPVQDLHLPGVVVKYPMPSMWVALLPMRPLLLPFICLCWLHLPAVPTSIEHTGKMRLLP